MKSKFRIFGAFAAFACALASGFAWGEAAEQNDLGTPVAKNGAVIYYCPIEEATTNKHKYLQVAFDEATNKNATVSLLCDILEDCQLVVSNSFKFITGKHSIGGTTSFVEGFWGDKFLSTITITNDAQLVLLSEGLIAPGLCNFRCAFEMYGGLLDASGGVFRYGGKPIISTYGPLTNNVVLSAVSLHGEDGTAIRLDSPGSCELKLGCEIEGVRESIEVPTLTGVTYVYVTNYFVNGVQVLNGDLTVDDASVKARVADLVLGQDIGDGTWQSPTGGVLKVSNSKLYGVEDNAIFAVAGSGSEGCAVLVSNSTIVARSDAIRLEGSDVKLNSTIRLTSTTVETSRDGAYAIVVDPAANWVVTIDSGSYYRMKKTKDGNGDIVEESWVVPGCKAVWDPETGNDNLRMTIAEGGKIVTVTFSDNDGPDALTTNREFTVLKDGEQSITNVFPWSDRVKTNAFFAGWYASTDDAENLRNERLSVSEADDKKTTLYAGWKTVDVVFYCNTNETDETKVKLDLTQHHEIAWTKSTKVLDVSTINPSNLFETAFLPDKVFLGWYLDRTCTGTKMTEVSVPTPSEGVELYAKWKEFKADDVAYVGDVGYTNLQEAVDSVSKGTNVVELLKDIVPALLPCVIKDRSGVEVIINMGGYDIGSADVSSSFVISNASVRIQGGGTVYGTINVCSDAHLELDGGKYVCATGSVISAEGANYTIIADNKAEFVAGEEDAEEGVDVLSLWGDGSGCVSISNSVIKSICPKGKEDSGVSLGGCYFEMAHSVLEAADFGVIISSCATNGVFDTTNYLDVVASSMIHANTGINAEPADIYVADSRIYSEKTAFDLWDGTNGVFRLRLAGTNFVEGGSAKKCGLFELEGGWLKPENIVISGGTYAHIETNEFKEAWIAEGCTYAWGTNSYTRFTVIDLNADKHSISYVTDLPPAAVTAGAKVTHSNEYVYSSLSTFKFNNAKCSEVNGWTCDFNGWALIDGGRTNLVTGIETGVVYYVEAKTNKVFYADYANKDLTLYAQWGEWHEIPDVPMSLYFKSGVIDPEMEDEAEFLSVEDENPNHLPTAKQEVIDGFEYWSTNVTVALPAATDVAWAGHEFSWWTAIYEDENGTVKTTGQYSASIDVKELARLEELGWDDTLHAVWDQGGGDESWNPTFDDMYNGERDKIMTGGDTYVGYISDNGQVIGKIVVKLGTPNGDGSIKVSATVTINGEGSKSFRGRGEYHGDYVYVSLENGEDQLDLTLDSKTIQSGSYNGYDVVGGVNLFKGSADDKRKADEALSPFLGRWLFVFSTVSAWEDARDKHGEVRETDVENAGAHAWGHSYVEMEVRNEGKVKLSGKLANGEDISATATAIIGDNLMCIPATCSVYSGKRGGGFGFTAYFKSSGGGSNETYQAAVDTNSVSYWDSSMSKKTPFVAEVVWANYQRVEDIELPESLLFCVDCEKPGLLSNTERLGDISDTFESWLPLDPMLYDFGYRQYVNILNGLTMKAEGKKTKMKLVDDTYIVPKGSGTNYSALKIKYRQKTGTFSGSFRIYSVKIDDESGESHLKKTKVPFHGAIADGRGWGFGHVKKIGSQPITLEDPAYSNRATRVDGTMIPGSDAEESGNSGNSGESAGDGDEEEESENL